VELATAEIPHETQYFLDAAGEHWEINAFDHAVLYLFADRPRLISIIEDPLDIRGWHSNRVERCLRLDRYAHEIAQQLSERENRAFFAASLVSERAVLHELAEVYAGWNFEDETTGGCLKPFKRGKAVQLDNHDNPLPRLNRHLHSPKAIRRYVKQHAEMAPHRAILATNLRRLPWPAGPAEAEVLEGYYEAMRERHRAVIAANVRRFVEREGLEYTPEEFAAGRIVRRRKRLMKQKRRIIRRSIGAAASVVGQEAVTDFSQGKPVAIPARSVVFSVRKGGGLGRGGHGAISVDLHSLEPEHQKLGSLCLYFDDMPALDQLAAIALHVESGNEDHLLDTGNVFAMTEHGVVNPAIMNRKSATRGVGFRDALGMPPEPIIRARRQAYIARTAPIYREALIARVWGSDAPNVRRFFAEIGEPAQEQRAA
jgi:hypothetical protein